jgi:hypothetical protein
MALMDSSRRRLMDQPLHTRDEWRSVAGTTNTTGHSSTAHPAERRGPPLRTRLPSHAEIANDAGARILLTARLLVLAIKFQDMIDQGEVCDYADLARLGQLSRAHITQVMSLLNLAPRLQDNYDDRS